MTPIHYLSARNALDDAFLRAFTQLSPLAEEILNIYDYEFNIVFESKTQSYREVLLGCALVRLLYPDINIRLPYVKQGANAFNGRTLDEQVVNPFLMSRQIPCSKGPYLATFRRNVRLDITTRSGLRDQRGYDAMLSLMEIIENSNTRERAEAFLLGLLKRFIILREKTDIQLASIVRMSVEQYSSFLNILLRNQSGGLIPLLATVALFQTIDEQYSCGWEIRYQGINAADGATGAPGDVTIFKDGHIFKAIEVTERTIGQTRVTTTFNTKISIHDARDYLFVYTAAVPEDGAYNAAKTYFAQGYDINFMKLSNLILSVFIAGNSDTRVAFTNKMHTLLKRDDVPATIKTAWNDSIQAVIGY